MQPWIHLFALSSLVLIARAMSLSDESITPPLGAIAHVTGPKNVAGWFRFSTLGDAYDVNVVISMNGLLQFHQNVGFGYHIHHSPTSNGNCSSSLGHFKTMDTKPTCLSHNHEWCQPAELALRHGNLSGLVDQFTLRYNDSAIYLDGPDSIIGRSIVIHGPAMARIACGTIEPWKPTDTV